MRLATSAGNGAACCLCEWKGRFADPREAEVEVREHLRRNHCRIMVARTDRKRKGSDEAACRYDGPRWGNELEPTIERGWPE